MCVQFQTGISILEEDTTYYKVVALEKETNTTRFKSCIKSTSRSRQLGYRSKGRVLNYKIGKSIKSSLETTPGLYCFTTLKAAALFIAIRSVPFIIEKIIKVKVTKGTKIRFATSPFATVAFSVLTEDEQVLNGREVVLVESLTPLELL